jgi:hypothetical protein
MACPCSSLPRAYTALVRRTRDLADTRRSYSEAGLDTLPVMVPVYSPVARFARPLVVSVPSAPAKRPVPPVITPGSAKLTTPGASVGKAWPLYVPKTVSPFAAVSVNVPAVTAPVAGSRHSL